jgi:hypothetical protein
VISGALVNFSFQIWFLEFPVDLKHFERRTEVGQFLEFKIDRIDQIPCSSCLGISSHIKILVNSEILGIGLRPKISRAYQLLFNKVTSRISAKHESAFVEDQALELIFKYFKVSEFQWVLV